MIKFFLDFENEIAEIEARINELRHLSTGKTVKILDEITDLEFKANKMLEGKICKFDSLAESTGCKTS